MCGIIRGYYSKLLLIFLLEYFMQKYSDFQITENLFFTEIVDLYSLAITKTNWSYKVVHTD